MVDNVDVPWQRVGFVKHEGIGTVWKYIRQHLEVSAYALFLQFYWHPSG